MRKRSIEMINAEPTGLLHPRKNNTPTKTSYSRQRVANGDSPNLPHLLNDVF